MIIQFVCNLLTSSNNHLLLQLCRWLTLVLEQAAAKTTMMVTYHHRHQCLLMSSLRNSWELEDYGGNLVPHCVEHGSWMPTTIGAWAESVQHFQGFPGHQASYLQGGRRTALGGWMAQHYWAKVLSIEGHRTSEGRICVPSAAGTGRDMVDPFPVLFTCQCTGHIGAIQVSL